MEKQEVLEQQRLRENTLHFLVDEANMLNVHFAYFTWTGITRPFFYFLLTFV